MIIGVNLGVQKVDSNAYDNLLDEEVLYYLNKANREYIRRQTVYLKEDLKAISRQDFIADSDAVDNLKTMIENEALANTLFSASSTYSNAKELDVADVTNPIFAIIDGQVTTSDSSGYRGIKEISPAEIHLYSKTDYNDAIFRRYPIVQVGSTIYVFYDAEGGDVYDMTLMYIRTPAKLVISSPSTGEVTTSELPVHTHDDVVNLAVAMILEDIKSARPYEQNQKTIKGEE